jgi:hypothetical protein
MIRCPPISVMFLYILTNTYRNQLVRLFTDKASADKNGSTTWTDFFY